MGRKQTGVRAELRYGTGYLESQQVTGSSDTEQKAPTSSLQERIRTAVLSLPDAAAVYFLTLW